MIIPIVKKNIAVPINISLCDGAYGRWRDDYNIKKPKLKPKVDSASTPAPDLD